jgi:hypothetical protein
MSNTAKFTVTARIGTGSTTTVLATREEAWTTAKVLAAAGYASIAVARDGVEVWRADRGRANYRRLAAVGGL